ncbi:MAG: phosphohydrolase [Nitrospiraceae bacterium]|nr:phosphohydrolase [Nitrospiraceae bacterium]
MNRTTTSNKMHNQNSPRKKTYIFMEKFRGLDTGNNEKLKIILNKVINDSELQAFWRVQNVTAIRRMKMNDHGHTHMRITAVNALNLVRLLSKANVRFNLEVDYSDKGFNFTKDDVEVVAFLSAITHDLGMTIHRQNHPLLSVIIANPVLTRLLRGVYPDDYAAIIKSEVLHSIYTHEKGSKPLTLEAGVLRLADALDMESGRARIPFRAGDLSIHAVSAMAIERVIIEEGDAKKPIVVTIKMKNSAGIFQITELLVAKLKDSSLKKYVKIKVDIRDEEEKIIDDFDI